MPFSIGDKAKIKKVISKKTYFIYEDFKSKSPYLICPCSLKGKIVVVKKIIDSNILLCTFQDDIMTIIYADDLDKISD